MARVLTDDDRRAELYRTQQKQRQTVLRERERRLRGNPALKTALFDRWAWLLDPPPDAEEHPDPKEPLI